MNGAKTEAVGVLAEAEDLRGELEALAGATTDPDERASVSRAADRIEASVIRPLRAALGAPGNGASADVASEGADRAGGDGSSSAGGELDERLRTLSLSATELCTRAGGPPELLEATAALQDLSLQLLAADADAADAHRQVLADTQGSLPASIQIAPDGPYLATNVTGIVDHFGGSLEPTPLVALCRCGASETKPWCDGSHSVVGFKGDKAADRVPDHLDHYAARQLELTDNRGLCAHSGFCTDRAPSAFRAHEEPFVAPAGDRLDQLVLAARDCPSGALGFRLSGDERPGQADTERPARIEISLDGPYRITGAGRRCRPRGRG